VPESIPAYITVRDSNLDNKYQQDAACRYQGLRRIIDKMKAARTIEDPPIPDEKNTKPPVVRWPCTTCTRSTRRRSTGTWPICPTTARPICATPRPCHAHPSPVAEARAAWGDIADAYCGSKPEIGFKAYDAIPHHLLHRLQHRQRRGQGLRAGPPAGGHDKFSQSACSKSPQAKPYLARIARSRPRQSRPSSRSALDIAIKNEEKGTERSWSSGREFAGASAIVTGAAAPAPRQQPVAAGSPRSAARSAPISTKVWPST